MTQALRVERLEELQAYVLDEAYDASPEEKGWCEDIADAIGELIARRRVEQARGAKR